MGKIVVLVGKIIRTLFCIFLRHQTPWSRLPWSRLPNSFHLSNIEKASEYCIVTILNIAITFGERGKSLINGSTSYCLGLDKLGLAKEEEEVMSWASTCSTSAADTEEEGMWERCRSAPILGTLTKSQKRSNFEKRPKTGGHNHRRARAERNH